jgi:hypothetical protein
MFPDSVSDPEQQHHRQDHTDEQQQNNNFNSKHGILLS